MKLMSLRERLFRPIAMLMCLLLALLVYMTNVFAYERINTDAETSLTMTFTEDDTGMEAVSFRLYQVADVSDTAEFTLTGGFAGAPVSLDDMTSAGDWADMAVTLSAYADANGISAGLTGMTDETGCITFSGLKVGLYLLAGDTAVVGDYSYTPAPTIIMLPTLMDDDSWAYAPSVKVKYTKAFLAETQDVTVKKVWNDGNRSGRPGSVKIQLLRDGAVYETVTLSAENNWTYTWSELASTYEDGSGETAAYTWAVHEAEVPKDYTVSVGRNGNTFTVTNAYKTTAVTPTDPTLPQTGTLNWPIPVMTVAGLLLVGLGWYLFSRKKEI